jgi:hypothetical protein
VNQRRNGSVHELKTEMPAALSAAR